MLRSPPSAACTAQRWPPVTSAISRIPGSASSTPGTPTADGRRSRQGSCCWPSGECSSGKPAFVEIFLHDARSFAEEPCGQPMLLCLARGRNVAFADFPAVVVGGGVVEVTAAGGVAAAGVGAGRLANTDQVAEGPRRLVGAGL